MLALLEEADMISSSGTESDRDIVSRRHKRNKQKDDKTIKKKVKYSLDKIKNKLVEERNRCSLMVNRARKGKNLCRKLKSGISKKSRSADIKSKCK